MSIPSNFTCVEQQIISVSSTSGSKTFTVTPPAGLSAFDLYLFNGGSKACQVALGIGSATAVQDGSANGTAQYKIGAGLGMLIKKNANNTVAAICEGADTTTLYCHAGTGQ